MYKFENAEWCQIGNIYKCIWEKVGRKIYQDFYERYYLGEKTGLFYSLFLHISIFLKIINAKDVYFYNQKMYTLKKTPDWPHLENERTGFQRDGAGPRGARLETGSTYRLNSSSFPALMFCCLNRCVSAGFLITQITIYYLWTYFLP